MTSWLLSGLLAARIQAWSIDLSEAWNSGILIIPIAAAHIITGVGSSIPLVHALLSVLFSHVSTSNDLVENVGRSHAPFNLIDPDMIQ
jgi:hypothetical protein